jgi:ribosome-binding protein aMBF1 (putative translation factor)
MNHQDWTTVTFKPKNTNSKNKKPSPDDKIEITKKYNAGKNTQHSIVNAKKIEKNDEEDKTEIPKISFHLQSQIQQARSNKNMTQKQLAVACNLTENKIKDFESGKGMPPDSKELRIMSRVLEVTLKK